MAQLPKSALVTGGSQRVGRALCEGLSAAGYAVAVHYHSSAEEAEKLVGQLIERGGTACAVKADLSNPEDVRKLLPRVTDELGPVGLLINNASLFEEDGPGQMNDAVWDDHFNVHVRAPALLAEAFAAQGLDEGLIVNIIDERVWKLTPRFMSYTLSKSALWTATRTLAQALAPTIRVNAIGPGPTLPSKRQSEEDFANQLDRLLLKRAPELQEFVDTILFFADARSVTGQMIALDGGQHLGWQTPDQHLPE